MLYTTGAREAPRRSKRMTTISVQLTYGDWTGKVHRITLTPSELIVRTIDCLAGEYDPDYNDGETEQIPTRDEFADECYKTLVAPELEVRLDGGIEVTIDTPKEIKFASEEGIRKIAGETYDKVLGRWVA